MRPVQRIHAAHKGYVAFGCPLRWPVGSHAADARQTALRDNGHGVGTSDHPFKLIHADPRMVEDTLRGFIAPDWPTGWISAPSRRWTRSA